MILLRGGNYLYMCKIKMLGQNTLEEPTRLLQEGTVTSRVFVFRFLNITVAN